MAGNSWGGSSATIGYRGTRATQPVNITYNNRNPGIYDTQNVVLGDQWLNEDTSQLWTLVALGLTGASPKHILATWVEVTNSAGDVLTLTSNDAVVISPSTTGNINVVGDGVTIIGAGFPGTNSLQFETTGIVPVIFSGNTGEAVPAAGNLNIHGASNITTTGATDTMTISVSGTTNHSVQVGNSGGSLTSVTNGTTGQVLTATTGADPSWQAPPADASTYTANTGTAAPAIGNINILGASGITTSATGSTVTITGSAVSSSFEGNTGTAAPAAGTINIVGTGGVSTSATGSTVTISSSGSVSGSYSFGAYLPTNQSINVISGQALGSAVALTNLYDNTSGAWFPGNGSGTACSFTAPVAGVYLFNINIFINSIGTSNLSSDWVLVSPSGNSGSILYYVAQAQLNPYASSPTSFLVNATIQVPLSISQNIGFNFNCTGSSGPVLQGFAGGLYYTSVSGYRIA